MLRVSLLCVGRMKAGAERDLENRYIERARAAGRALGLDVEIRETTESKARRLEDRRAKEALAIRAMLAPAARLVAFDETGDTVDSAAFAMLIGTARDEGLGSLALVIGGPDGLEPALIRSAFRSLAFGAMTWPHQLVRVMASEQIYRAVTILGGHPYHRA